MTRKFSKIMALLLCCVGCSPSPKMVEIPPPPTQRLQRFVVYYEMKLPATEFADYDVVVLGRIYYPEFKAIQPKSTVLGYVSIGEVAPYQPEAKTLSARTMLGKNPNGGNDIMDLREPEWRRTVMAHVDEAMQKGFDGVMFDTMDSPLWVAAMQPDPTMKAQMHAAAVSLIAEVRAAYPHAKIMLNRGFAILPDVAPMIDMILAESILSKPDDSTGQFSLFSPITYAEVAQTLKQAERISSNIKIYTLDYWNQDDVAGIQRIYAIQRANGFIPYVSTQLLNEHTPEPHRLGPPFANNSLNQRG